MDLDRSPFTAGLRAARQQARDFERERFTVTITPTLNNTALNRIRRQIASTSATINIRAALDNASLAAVRQRINSAVGRVRVNATLDNTSLTRVVAQIERRRPTITVNVRLDDSSLTRVVRQIQARRPSIPVSVTLDNASLTRVIAQIEARRPTLHVNVDIDNASVAAAIARIEASRPTLTVNIDYNRSALDRLLATSGGGGGGSVLRRGERTTAALSGAAVGGALGNLRGSSDKFFGFFENDAKLITAALIFGLAPALGVVASALAALPAIIAAVASGFAVVILGVDGIKKAASGLSDEFKALKASVSSTFEKQLTPVFNSLAKLFPTLTTGANQIAVAISGVAAGLAKIFTSSAGMQQLKDIFAGIAQFIKDSQPGIEALTSGFLKLTQVGTQNLGGFATALNNFGTSFQDMINKLSATGQLQAAMDGLYKVIDSLLIGFNKLFMAGIELMPAMVGPLTELINTLVDSVVAALPGFTQLSILFVNILTPVLRALVPLFQMVAAVLEPLNPVIRALADTISGVLIEVLTALTPLFAQIAESIGGALMAALDALRPVLPILLDAFKQMIPPITEVAKLFGDALVTAIKAIAPSLPPLVQAFANLLTQITPLLPMFAGLAAQLIEMLAPILPVIIDAFVQLLGAVTPLIPYIVDLVKSMLPALSGILKVIGTILTEVVVPIFKLLVDILSRYVLPIVAGLAALLISVLGSAFDVLALIINKGIIPALNWVIDSFKGVIEHLKQAYDAIVYFCNNAGSIFTDWGNTIAAWWTGLWDGFTNKLNEWGSWLGTKFTELKDGFVNWITDVVTTVTNAWNNFWDGVANKLNEWNTWLVTTLTGIRDGFLQWINDVATNVTNAWNSFWDKVANKLNEWASWVVNKYNEIRDGFISWINNLATTVTNAWNNFWDGVANKFSEWGDWIRNKYNEIRDGFVNWINNLASSITQKWTELWDWVGRKLEEARDWLVRTAEDAAAKIGQAWRAVANFFRDPINWVINVVLNDGILGAWNTVMGWIGADSLSVSKINEIPQFATGGRVVGPGSGTSDSIPALLSNGEYVVRAAVARQHMNFLNALNQGQLEANQAAGGGNNPNPYPGIRRYQAGGAVDAGMNFARSQAGKPYVWGGVGPGGYDCSGFMSAITNVLRGQNPYSRLGSTASAPWPGFTRGLTSQFGIGWFVGNPGHMAGTLAGTNVESSGGVGVRVGGGARGARDSMFNNNMSLPQVGGQFVGGFGGSASATAQTMSMWDMFGQQASELFKSVLNFAGMPGGDSLIGKGIQQIPIKIVDKVIEAAKKKLEAMMTVVAGAVSAVGSAIGSLVGISSNTGVQQQVQQVAAQFGWGSGAQWDAILRIVQKESSWNPNAANQTSSARGLFQKMTSLYGAVEPTPAGQALWGLNYIRRRYGTPSAALAFHNANNWYDRGGMMMPGPNFSMNLSNRPERVLSPRQTDAFDRLVDILDEWTAQGGMPGSNDSNGSPAIGTLVVQTTPRATAQDIVEEVTFQVRNNKRFGPHS